jgi:CheY-like chemotaxis protein
VDYRLGAESGIELVQELTANGHDTPLIVITGQGDRDVDVAAAEAGADDYLVKGETTPELLERTIRHSIQRRAQVRALREGWLGQAQRTQRARRPNNHLTLLPVDGVTPVPRTEAAPSPEPAESPNERWVITGAFSRFHDREELFEDLDYAVKPQTAPTVLVLFGFKKLADRLEHLLEPDANLLLGRIAKRLAEATDLAAALYESRRGEFCGLFGGRLEEVEPLLGGITKEIDDEVGAFGIQTALGIVTLPAEAASPIAALRLADQRREQIAGNLRPSPRRTAYSRIIATLHFDRDFDDVGA